MMETGIVRIYNQNLKMKKKFYKIVSKPFPHPQF